MRTLTTFCTECGSPVTITTKAKLDSYRRSGRTYCSTRCRDAWVSRDSSQRMSRTNRTHASERMRRRNPMQRPEPRAKMRETLKAIGHAPRERGGNGRPPPEPERLLVLELDGWGPTVVSTGRPRRAGWPTHYKIDLANPERTIAVEIDGGSHFSLGRRAADQRKDSFLRSEGWSVLRFSNAEVMADPAAVARRVRSSTT
jgi:hypothetical protein